MAEIDQSNLTILTIDLLSAYVANNNVQHGDLAELIKSTHAALKVIDAPELAAPEEPRFEPAVSVRKSLSSNNHIISLIDGKPYQTLKRHLSRHGLTPAQYRERYSLPDAYPMVAKAYSESRRAIAEKLGLGRRVKPAASEGKAPVEKHAAKAPSALAQKPTPPKAARVTKQAVSAPEKIKATRKGAPAAAHAPITEAAAKSVSKTPTSAAPKPATVESATSSRPVPRKRSAKAVKPVA